MQKILTITIARVYLEHRLSLIIGSPTSLKPLNRKSCFGFSIACLSSNLGYD